MNTQSKVVYGIGLVAVLSLVLGFVAVNKSVVVNNQQPNFGAVGTLDNPSIQYMNIGGVPQYFKSQPLNQGSTTICSILSPTEATSTLRYGAVRLTTGTTTAIALEMAKASVMDATTTRITLANLASGARITMNSGVGTSTTSILGSLGLQHSADESDLVFAPGTYLNVKYGGVVNGTTNVLVGKCEAVFTVN